MKTGILMVSFGTSHSETREKNISRMAEAIQEVYAETPVYQAFSSDIVRAILQERDQLEIPDIEKALKKMAADGITDVKILPTHVIDGIENQKMKTVVNGMQSEFHQIDIAGPLLLREEDYVNTAEALWNELKGEAEGNILVLMGHGTPVEADGTYTRLEEEFHRQGHKDVYIATVEGKIGINEIIAKMQTKGYHTGSRVILTPFMMVAGDHAVNDMAGTEEDSFASRLTEAGYEVSCIIKGLGEYARIRSIYLGHLKEIYQEWP